MQEGILVLEDGRCFRGNAFGATATVAGEAVFNTSITGYQEILTDPSYAGQLVTLTTPQIGNTGTNPLDDEAQRPAARALIMREVSPLASSWRSREALPSYLARQGVFGLTGVDTRALTRHLRSAGAMRGILAAGESSRDLDRLLREVRSSPVMEGADLVREVSCTAPYTWSEPTPSEWISAVGEELRTLREHETRRRQPSWHAAPLHVVAIDCGLKRSILRQLVDHGFSVTVVPAATSGGEILALRPAGVFVSNGPGDPAAVTYVVATLRTLLGRVPLFGICLGHQLLALALGGRTYKLKFGHRGGNHPVQELSASQSAITAHNHGFAVDPQSLPTGVRVTHVDLNDQTCEGLAVEGLQAFSIQYHPEAGPGPHDALEHFSRFRALMSAASRLPGGS